MEASPKWASIGPWALHLLAGQAEFGADSGLPALQAGDTAWLSAGERQRHALQGGGELLAIRVSAATMA